MSERPIKPELPEEPLPRVLLVPEVAALLRLERKTVYALVQKGEIGGVLRVGRKIVFDRNRLLRWIPGEEAVS